MNKLFKILGLKPRLSREAIEAYLNRLPDVIQVDWVRNDDFIVGEVKAGEHTFMTQGKDAQDFIDMVNDGVVMINKIPKNYREIILKTYIPSFDIQKLIQT